MTQEKRNRQRYYFITAAVVILLVLLILLFRSCGAPGSEPESPDGRATAPSDKSAAKTEEKVRYEIADVIAVSAGNGFSAALTKDGNVWTWGNNTYGQLGNGKKYGTLLPAVVLKDVASISAGTDHCLAVKKDGTLWEWGRKEFDSKADAAKSALLVPVQVMTDVETASAGDTFSVALKKDGSVWTWGDNNAGQLGNSTETASAAPVMILQGVKKISAGGSHCLAVKDDGTLWGWGLNHANQLMAKGDKEVKLSGKTGKIQTQPVQLMENIADTAAGGLHSLALDKDGSLWAWGSNGNGQIGNNYEGANWVYYPSEATTTYVVEPKKVLTEVAAISAGGSNSSAIRKDGTLWVWGNNQSSQVGDGKIGDVPVPKQILDSVEAVSSGRSHMLAIRKDRSLWSWGSNRYGELGDGYSDKVSKPVQILDDIKQVSTSGVHVLALKSDGKLYAFGGNGSSQFGDGTLENSSHPKIVMEGVVQAAAGSSHTLCLKDDGTLWSWGGNMCGQLGNGKEDDIHYFWTATHEGRPVTTYKGEKILKLLKSIYYSHPENVMKDVEKIYAHGSTSYTIKKDGSLWAWGSNEYGYMGDGTKISTATPKKVMDNVRQLLAPTLAIKNDGSLWAWGRSVTDPYSPDYSPRKIMDHVVSAAHFNYYYLAVTEDGTLWAYGRLSKPIPGEPEKKDNIYTEPVKIGEGMKSVLAVGSYRYLIDKDDTLWSVGFLPFTSVSGYDGNAEVVKLDKAYKMMEKVKTMEGTSGFGAVLKTDGTLWTFGDNNYGQVGDGRRFFVPRQISRK